MRALFHTADVGIEVDAPTLAELFHRSAAGMMALIYESRLDPEVPAAPAAATTPWPGEPPESSVQSSYEVRDLELHGEDPPSLLAEWLRELLYLHEVHGFAYAGADFWQLTGRRLRARVRGVRPSIPPVREIKGVTYHELSALRDATGWHSRTIFDV